VRAKALALNPNVRTNSGAVLLMGSPQPIIVFNTATGQVLQRFTPAFMKGTESTTSKAGSFTGITYSADGKSLFFSQDDNHVVIATVDPRTGLLTKRTKRHASRSAGGWPALSQCKIDQPGRHRSFRRR